MSLDPIPTTSNSYVPHSFLPWVFIEYYYVVNTGPHPQPPSPGGNSEALFCALRDFAVKV